MIKQAFLIMLKNLLINNNIIQENFFGELTIKFNNGNIYDITRIDKLAFEK